MPAPALLSYDDLREHAEAAVAASGLTRAAVAARLGVTPGAVTQALREAGGRRSGLQARIIEELTGRAVRELPARFEVAPPRAVPSLETAKRA